MPDNDESSFSVSISFDFFVDRLEDSNDGGFLNMNELVIRNLLFSFK